MSIGKLNKLIKEKYSFLSEVYSSVTSSKQNFSNKSRSSTYINIDLLFNMLNLIYACNCTISCSLVFACRGSN